MKLIGKQIIFGLCAAATAVVACSTGPSTAPTSTGAGTQIVKPATGDTNGTGALGMQLTLPGGGHFSTVSYKLSNAANTYTGSYNISGTTTLSFVIGSVAAGTGYQITLTTTSDDGSVTCAFPQAGAANTSNITVVNRTTTVVNLNMQCTNNQGLDAGNVLVNATESICPVWNTIVGNPVNITLDAGQNVNDSGQVGSTAFYMGLPAAPAVINVGSQLVLVGSATAPNPGALAFAWTSTGGTISSPTGTLDPNSTDAGITNQTIFTCTAAGTFTVTLTLSDGPLPDGGTCDPKFTTGSIQVTCNSLLPCGGGPVAAPNSAAGTCPAGKDSSGFDLVNAGTADSVGNFCCIGACGDGSVGQESTPFSATGSCAAFAGTANNGAGCCVGLHPCTVVGDTTCVQCQGNDKAPNANKTCTPTEAALVQHDITKGKATAAGADPAGSCYTCLFNGGCIDDTHFGDTGHECEDSLTTGTAAQCEATLSCIFGSNCAASAVSVCYCGTAGLTTTCQGNPAPGPINGSCDMQISTGLGFPLTDGTDNTAKLTDVTRAAGRADQLFQCALTNGCTACQM